MKKMIVGLALLAGLQAQNLPQGFVQTASYNAPNLYVTVTNYSYPVNSTTSYVVMMAFPGVGPLPPLEISPLDPMCVILEDSTGVWNNNDLSGMGSTGNPSKTWVFPILAPFAFMRGITFKIQTMGQAPNLTWFNTNFNSVYINTNNLDDTTHYWSNPASWPGNQVPGNGANVDIPEGTTITLDTNTANLTSLMIAGALVVDTNVDTSITTGTLHVHNTGLLICGTEASPTNHNFTITLNAPRGVHTQRTEDYGLDNDPSNRGLMVMGGGTLRLFGQVPTVLKTKLGDHAAKGATSFTLADSVTWKAGDKIAISMTDFYGVGSTEVLTLSQDVDNSTTINTVEQLVTPRWGKLQYPLTTPVAGSAVGLTPDGFIPPTGTAGVIDERAEVVNLSRKIVIQAPDDSDWQNNGFGMHVMVMNKESSAQVSGVQFLRGGQRRAMGRYPFHWHMASFSEAIGGVGGGVYQGDVAKGSNFLKNCSIWKSENRAVTIHGTCGVSVDTCFAVDILNHAFFLEDGTEMNNSLCNNVAMKMRFTQQSPLKQHDTEPSGFWLTNPRNIVKGNSASDAAGRGLWNTFANNCFGMSRNSTIIPSLINIKLYEDNMAHSNNEQGIATEFIVVDERGNIANNRYAPADGRFTLSRNFIWKNKDGGYLNRVGVASYLNWVAADNNTRDFQGQTMPTSLMRGTLLIAKSLNSATPFADPHRIGLASYHFTFDVEDIVAINYQFVSPTIAGNGQFVYGGGVFDTSDLYDKAIGLGMWRNINWRLINSNCGYITPSPYFDGFPLAVPGTSPQKFRYWSLPGALWDPYGYWTTAGYYMIPNNPFYTYQVPGLIDLAPAGQNGKATPMIFHGLADITFDNETVPGWGGPSLMPLRLARLDSSLNEVGEHTIGEPSLAQFFPGMRYFSVADGGIYKLTIPSGRMPISGVRLGIENGYRATDSVVICLPWPGTVPVAGRYDAGLDGFTEAQKISLGVTRLFTFTGTSVNDVINGNGSVAWQDTTNARVWVKLVGGMNVGIYPDDGRSDDSLRKTHFMYLRPQ